MSAAKKVGVFCLLLAAVIVFIPIDSALSQQNTELSPKEVKLDTNFDGIVDRVEVYDDNKVIVRVEADTSGDGKINEWINYENGKPAAAEKDNNGDGKPDTFVTYNSKGKAVKSETDTSGDGKVDEWIYYKDGAIIKAEKDNNGDGKPDTWATY